MAGKVCGWVFASRGRCRRAAFHGYLLVRHQRWRRSGLGRWEYSSSWYAPSRILSQCGICWRAARRGRFSRGNGRRLRTSDATRSYRAPAISEPSQAGGAGRFCEARGPHTNTLMAAPHVGIRVLRVAVLYSGPTLWRKNQFCTQSKNLTHRVLVNHREHSTVCTLEPTAALSAHLRHRGNSLRRLDPTAQPLA